MLLRAVERPLEDLQEVLGEQVGDERSNLRRNHLNWLLVEFADGLNRFLFARGLFKNIPDDGGRILQDRVLPGV